MLALHANTEARVLTGSMASRVVVCMACTLDQLVRRVSLLHLRYNTQWKRELMFTFSK